MTSEVRSSRRRFVGQVLAAGAGVGLLRAVQLFSGAEPQPSGERPALIAITLDLEMSRNFPKWEMTEWDYEKGNLDEDSKKYTLKCCRRVAERGGRIHCFAVGRTLEQPNVEWLKEIAKAGHAIGNHTYDHVNVLAKKPEEIQYRFRRAPWLLEGKSPHDVIEENIRLATEALRTRAGIEVNGFRTPGGFAEGLNGREDVQKMLLAQGFKWVSSRYPQHIAAKAGEAPTRALFDDLVRAQKNAQPYAYPSGLIEVPMSPISDIGAFRTGRWELDHFLKAIRMGVERAIEQRAVFDFLAHPSCLGVVDPQGRTIDLICDLVQGAGKRAKIVTLDEIAATVAGAKS